MKRSFPRSILPGPPEPLSPDASPRHASRGHEPAETPAASAKSSGETSREAADAGAEWPLDADDFAAYYRFAPSALALRECLRLRAVRKHALDEPILDIGCGDGLFARLAHPDKQIWGIDVNPVEIRRAQATAVYSTLVCGNISTVDLPIGFFKGAIANCSMEHVPGLDDALKNIRRALAPGGQLILIVPTPAWTQLLAVPMMLREAGFGSLASAYGEGLDKVFHHLHLYDDAEWSRRLVEAGFRVKSVEMLTSKRSSWMFDILLYPSLFGWVTKKLTGRWVLAPFLRTFTADLTRTIVNAIAKRVPDADDGSEYLIVAEVPEADAE